MSRTQIHLIMENNKNKINSIVGFNANNDGACFEFLYNLSGNEKQCINAPNLDFLTEFDINSSIYNGNINELPYFTKESEESTYTLDDLLNFVSDMPENDQILIDTPFMQLPSDKSQAPEVLMDTALASPLSASSEESCCLDDLLFNNESPAELEFSEDKTEVLNSSNCEHLGEDTQEPVSTDSEPLASILQENALGNHSELTTESFDTLWAMILQSQCPDEVGINNDSSEISLPMESPSSPSSSEADSTEVRYSPYKRTKKQKTPEQRQRKKVQNRNAALRYRVKKKDQFHAMNAEAEELEEKNRELKGKVDGLRSEIDYLKNLMLDVIKARLAKGTLPANFLSLALESS